MTDLSLSCVESDGLRRDSPEEQRERLHVASPLGGLYNSDVGVGAKDLIVKGFEIPCSQKKTENQ